MKAVDVVKTSLQLSQNWIMGLITDMQDAPLTSPTPLGGNHPLWVLGHLVYSETELREGLILGRPNPLEGWKELFGAGSQPLLDASRYPSFAELLAKFQAVRADTLTYVDTLVDEDLDKPTQVPPELKEFFGTVGACLTAIALHFTFHGGQIADARKAAGRAPLMG